MQYGGDKLTDTTENILKRSFVNNLGDLSWGQRAVDTEEVCDETSNVRSSHGCSRNGFGPPIIPSGSDVQAGSEDIDGGTIIGELGPCILDSRSGDGNRFPNTSGGGIFCVPIIVSSGYNDGNTAVGKLKTESFVSGAAIASHPLGAYRFNSPVNTDRSTAAQAHRSNRW